MVFKFTAMATKKKTNVIPADEIPNEKIVIEKAVIEDKNPDYAELMRKKYSSLNDARGRADFENLYKASQESEADLKKWHKYLNNE